MNRKTMLRMLVSVVALFCATAKDAAAQSLTVAPSNPAIPAGQTQQFTTPDVSNAAGVEAGDYHVCVQLQNGEVRCSGRNNAGQLGAGGGDSATPLSPIQFTQGAGVATGGFHSCAVRRDGTVQCWGMNDYGQLGDGSTADSTWPASVAGITTATAVAAGYMHSCALLQNGTVQCWGDNTYGQLGDGTPIAPGTPRGGPSTAHSSVPVTVVGISAAVAVTASDGYHSCAVLQDGTVRCWGDNVSGQLGDGTRTGTSTPVTVSGISTAVTVSSGDFHTCALLLGGAVSCWGLNWTGQLGDGTSNDSDTPVPVSGISTAVAVSAGVIHTCAVLQDGTARCWGYNSNGQIGNGTLVDAHAPAMVSGITSATSITAGNNDSCAVLRGGLVRCWGMNSYGELGNGTTADADTPTVVVDINPMWTTSNPAVATIDATGLATGIASGSVTITATTNFYSLPWDRFQPRESRSGSTTLTVGERPRLTVVRDGTGTGTVTSSPAGINCGTACSAAFDTDTVVTLTAAPLNGTNFAGWSGCDTASDTTCTVTVSSDRSIRATFSMSTLTVMKAGNGRGGVTSSEPGIDCGPNVATCAASYSNGTALTLTAAPAAGSRFDTWSGCDSANAEVCGVTINGSRTVTAAFALLRFTLSVNKSGIGSGTVTSAPGGISCGSTCSALYESGTVVTLTATPAFLSVFAGWSGCDTVSGESCIVNMSAATSVTASFLGVPLP
jgi:alpha-tubulin suppressor-like RCC1 family protein